MKTKKCSRCKEVRPITEFWKNKYMKDGFRYWCKNCGRKYQNIYIKKLECRKKKSRWDKKNYKENGEKIRECVKKYRAKNKDKIKELNKEYRIKNLEKIKEQDRKYYIKNKDKHNKKSKKYYEKNKIKMNGLARKYYAENKEKLINKQKLWKKRNPEKVHISQVHRRARKMKAEGSYTIEEWKSLKDYYGNICLCCKKTELEIKLTEDHIISLFNGGTNYINNIQPLCQSCNSSKNLHNFDYRQEFLILSKI